MIFHYVMRARAFSYYYRHHSCACVQTFRWGTTIKRDRRRPAASAAPPTDAAVYSRPRPHRARRTARLRFFLFYFISPPPPNPLYRVYINRCGVPPVQDGFHIVPRAITEACIAKSKGGEKDFFPKSASEENSLNRSFFTSHDDSVHLGFPHGRSPVIARRRTPFDLFALQVFIRRHPH